jgi:hypothetical protein
MLRTHLRALAAIQADLDRRARVEGLARAARQLFAFYDRENQLADVLTGSAAPPPTRPARRRRPKREKLQKPTSADFSLAILRKSSEPLSAREIGEHLAVEHRQVGRQAMSYTLIRLEREGKVERVQATEGHARYLWRVVE